jgi:cytochrome c551/c552
MKFLITGFFSVRVGLLLLLILNNSCSDNGGNQSTGITYSDPMHNKGIGPVKELQLGPLDTAMAAEGKVIYESKCTACHHPTEKLIGPPQKGILERRAPEWVMNMMLNPEEMLARDPIAKQLLKEYNNVPMTDQKLSYADTRKILEYLRTL